MTVQAALMKAELERSAPGLSDQEIRARALESAVRFAALPAVPAQDADILVIAKQFEDYIRNGK